MLVYVCNHVAKTGDAWRVHHTAAYHALSLEQFATHFGVWLRQFPDLLKV